MKIFPDQAHIEQIRKRLWCGREFGQAAVMVGAGFSRNAEKISNSTPNFPLWGNLAELIYKSLYPPENFPGQDYEKMKLRATSSAATLRLASEYETVFGRSALDDLLLQSIPDTYYLPKRLHELLLSLPWSDVFTTNYDTLLERTLPAIHDRKYDVIRIASDIPGRMKPRIVKLHGSFPSHRPFILTEEDYRTYPTRFAPFVNMVQQAIMENAFCLLGFSGEDPNFLYWSGWVRDNLGPTAPPIYLCNLLNLSASERRLLESKKIIPIDLSPLFPVSDWFDPELRYAKALEWFLLNLMYGAPPNVVRWPIPSTGNIWKPSDGLPAIPSGPTPLSNPGEQSPDDIFASLQAEDLEKLYKVWRRTRQEYPGWVVAPRDNRESLWDYTERWVEPVLHSIDKLSPPQNLFLLYELNWRLETTLTPLFLNWVEIIEPILHTFNPYPRLVKLEEASIRPDKDEYKHLDWKAIGEVWVQLTFALAREAREDQDEKRFRLWMDRLRGVVKQRVEWQARWFYEDCLFYLFQLNQEKVRATLEEWPEIYDLPLWEVKRASILAELGELKEAEKVAEVALDKIRSRLQPYAIDYTLLSEEGWTMVLLKIIKDNKWGAEKDFVAQYRDRWEKLRSYRCDPWPDIETLESIVDRPRPIPKPEREITKGFDPGRVSPTYHFFSGLNITDIRPAFAFLRMLEEGGSSVRCGMVISEAVINSAKWIELFAPLWSISAMIRAGKEKEIKKWFDRIFVATLTQDEVDRLNQLFIASFTQSTQDLINNPQKISLDAASFSQRQVTLLSELLSRLCFRFSAVQLTQLFQLALNMYRQPIFRNYHSLHDCVNTLFQRLLYAMPQSEVLQRIPQLLSLPIPTEGEFEVQEPQLWAEPFAYIKWLENSKLDTGVDRSAWSAPIAHFIRVVESGTAEARGRAVLRLAKLHEIEGLTSEENEAFARALWSRIDPDTGLPSDTGLMNFSFLILPETDRGRAKENFRKYLLSTDFPRMVRRSTTTDGKQFERVGIGPSTNRFIREWLAGTLSLLPQNEKKEQKFVDWTPNEVIQLLQKVAAWWDDEKGELREDDVSSIFSVSGKLREQFSSLVELMALVILPRLRDVDTKTKNLARRVLSEMEQSGFDVQPALPMVLFIDPASYDEVTQKLRIGLISLERKEVRAAISGLCNWLAQSFKQYIPAPPADLLNDLVNKVVARRQPGLDVAVGQLSMLIKRLPELLNGSQIEALCVALEYLAKETELPSKLERETISDLSTIIAISDRPEYRALAAELAHQLFIYFTSRNKEVPSILVKWREICQNDPLPEVRRVWQQIV
jgi:hypothetical protein